LAGTVEGVELSFLDARPLVVGPCTKDADARPGRVYGGFARGYKLHACVTQDGRIPVWKVTSLQVPEQKIACELVDRVKPAGLVLADGVYDSGAVYEAVEKYGGLLVTPNPGYIGVPRARQSQARLRSVRACRGLSGYIYRERLAIERCFAQQSSFGGGLAPLPAWVRTLPRVRRWVGAKLIIYHIRHHLRRAAI
jgi:hypothetical protein